MKDTIFNLDINDYPIGESVTHYVNFPSFYGLQKVRAPLFVHRASEDISPCVVVTACMHGDEISGIRSAQTIIQSKMKLLKGTLIILPVVNIYGFLNKQRYLPDRKDLNRCFPGTTKGSFGSRFANFIFQNISRYGDVFIDLHSGATGRFNVPQIRCDLNNPEIKELINHVSIPLVINSSLRDGSLREAINDLGKPCIVFEGGEGLRLDETITKYSVNLIKSILVHYKMIKSKKDFNSNKLIINRTRWARAKEGGLFVNKASQGKLVRKGEIVGELRNLVGEKITSIKMENDGVILGISRAAHIMSGDALYNIGFFDTTLYDDEDEFSDFFDID